MASRDHTKSTSKFNSHARFGVTKKAVLVALGILSMSQVETAQAMSIKQRLAHNFREQEAEDNESSLIQLQSRIRTGAKSLNLAQL